MKLTAKSSLYYLIYTLFIFAIGTVVFYFLIQKVLHDAIDEALHQEKNQVVQNLKYENDFAELHNSDFIDIVKVYNDVELYDKYYTRTIYDSILNENIDYRELKSVYKHGGNLYEITIRQSLSESKTLLKSILPIEVTLFLGLIIGVLLINRYISDKIFQPFYDLVEKLKFYDLVTVKIIPYEKSNVEEFDELSEIVEKMTTRIYKNYTSQKEFNENSAHELQTPLAIIRNKLELLIQSKNLTDDDMALIESMFFTINRLTQLNKSLILLSKIENDQYGDLTKIDIDILLVTILDYFEEFISDKNIKLELDLEKLKPFSSNIVLIETLLTNLISNAIKHNVEGGHITIRTYSNNILEIKNTGAALEVDPERMFGRFSKNSTTETSVGLGLAIVKKICDYYNFSISYTNLKNEHTIKIQF
jgi:signal transduction histidine kinase